MRSEAIVGLARALVAGALLLGAGAAAAAEPLVGSAVGNADALHAEGNRLYNRRQYAAAAEKFLQATRAAPEQPANYLSLARARLAAKRVAEACYAYRVFVRSAPEGEERRKGQRELELCERRSRAARMQVEETARSFVERKASFFAALEARRLVGEGGAAEILAALVRDGYLGPDLGEMASQLSAAAQRAAEDLHRRALAREATDLMELAQGPALYDAAAAFGPKPAGFDARRAFLEGAFELRAATRLPEKGEGTVPAVARREGSAAGFRAAIERLSAAVEAAPEVADYRFFRALAIWRSGDRRRAIEVLQKDLPHDPRTAVARAIVAVEEGAGGARALEDVLFATRFPADRG